MYTNYTSTCDYVPRLNLSIKNNLTLFLRNNQVSKRKGYSLPGQSGSEVAYVVINKRNVNCFITWVMSYEDRHKITLFTTHMNTRHIPSIVNVEDWMVPCDGAHTQNANVACTSPNYGQL